MSGSTSYFLAMKVLGKNPQYGLRGVSDILVETHKQLDKGFCNSEEQSGLEIQIWVSLACKWHIKPRNWKMSLGAGCRRRRV